MSRVIKEIVEPDLKLAIQKLGPIPPELDGFVKRAFIEDDFHDLFRLGIALDDSLSKNSYEELVKYCAEKSKQG